MQIYAVYDTEYNGYENVIIKFEEDEITNNINEAIADKFPSLKNYADEIIYPSYKNSQFSFPYAFLENVWKYNLSEAKENPPKDNNIPVDKNKLFVRMEFAREMYNQLLAQAVEKKELGDNVLHAYKIYLSAKANFENV